MLVRWIPDTPDTIPANASHRVGIGAFVFNNKKEVIFFSFSIILFSFSIRPSFCGYPTALCTKNVLLQLPFEFHSTNVTGEIMLFGLTDACGSGKRWQLQRHRCMEDAHRSC